MCKAALFSALQYLLPQHWLSRGVAHFAETEHPAIKDFLIRQFLRRFNVNLAEAERENPSDYRCFNDFFTRALKADARPFPSDPAVLMSPVDGTVSQIGRVSTKGRIFQAKGREYSLMELLGGEFKDIYRFQGNFFSTIYLAPQDYHRVHVPLDATLLAMTYCPGDLFSVNPATTASVPNLFARNERAVMFFDTAQGKMALVMVGAMLVAGIETVFSGRVTPSPRKEILHIDYTNQPNAQTQFKRGDELGRFQFGSTVIVLHECPTLEPEALVAANTSLRLGQALGRFQ